MAFSCPRRRSSIACLAALFQFVAFDFSLAQTGAAFPSKGEAQATSTQKKPDTPLIPQIRLLVGSGPGGGYDTYARLLAGHLPRHLPGEPRIVVQNMPGAGSLVVTNYLVNIAPNDGSVFAGVHSLTATHPLFYPDRAKYDARKLVWLGSAVREKTFGLAATSSKVVSFRDSFAREMIVAGSTGSTTSFPAFLNAVLGTRFNVVKGYNATSAGLLALERGEVDGVIGITGPGMKGTGDRLLDEGKARVFIQFGMSRHMDYLKTDWIFDYGDNQEQRMAMSLMFGTQEFGRPYIAPPGVPTAVAHRLRDAVSDTLKDSALLNEAAKRQLDIEYTSPDEIQAIIAKMYDAPPDVIASVKKVLGDQTQ